MIRVRGRKEKLKSCRKEKLAILPSDSSVISISNGIMMMYGWDIYIYIYIYIYGIGYIVWNTSFSIEFQLAPLVRLYLRLYS